MVIGWTEIQKQRLQELNASEDMLAQTFADPGERNRRYQKIEQDLVSRGRESLLEYQRKSKKPALLSLEFKLSKALRAYGFSRVTTPILLSKGLLARMNITELHPLYDQVYWVDEKKCLRPMLAPNLYYLLKDLLRVWEHPVSIFEIGACFRKDTRGSSHLPEFTMLNLVEMGLPEKDCRKRLKELACLVMEAVEINDYNFETVNSEVYGETFDIVSNNIEIGSAAMGPHSLDQAWGITVPWVGIGFGLERILAVKKGFNSVQKAGRSLSYLDGIRLNIQ
ncbi:MAG: pyrrolysine--tRNA(Pyl) ligase large subunit [Bacillota bacterium]|nr:pyrrolysine--tRNA(Pyl) ligase large subunit [Bacillota bacterium]